MTEYGGHDSYRGHNSYGTYDSYASDDDARPLSQRQVALIDLLDRLLSGGVVLTGDVVLSVADIDLVRISLRAVVVAVHEQLLQNQWDLALPTGTPTQYGEHDADPA
jgi:gas vesicle protein GvpA/GvpJ/GvpM family